MTSPHGPPPLILKSTSPLTHANHATSSPFVMSNPLYNPPSKDATSSSHHWAPYSNFLDIPEQIFAQQLTKMDCVRKTCNIFCTIISSFLFSVKKFEFFFNKKCNCVFCRNYSNVWFLISALEPSGLGERRRPPETKRLEQLWQLLIRWTITLFVSE